MTFVFISDTHGQHARLLLPPGDVLVHCGDFSQRGRPHEVAEFMQWFGQQPYAYRVCIAGNHDFMAEQAPEAFADLVPAHVCYLCDSGVEIGGIRLWGSPITPWFFDWAFNRQRGAEIRPHWALIPPDTDILLTHGPPYGILDRVAKTGHPVGCRDLLRSVEALRPRLHVFGHIHEGYGRLEGPAGTLFLNASVLDTHYALCNAPWQIDLP